MSRSACNTSAGVHRLAVKAAAWAFNSWQRAALPKEGGRQHVRWAVHAGRRAAGSMCDGPCTHETKSCSLSSRCVQRLRVMPSQRLA